MNREEIKGKSYQKHEPTPDKPCEIKTRLCNDIEIPVEFLKQNFVTVDGKKYIELQQQNKKYKEVIDKAILIIKGIAYGGSEDYYIEKLKIILDILKEVK